jgi:hypothetical protein
MTTGYVSAIARVSEDNLSLEDANVIGTYCFESKINLSDEELSNALLNNFHNIVPVNALEDFEFRTYNTKEKEIFESSVISEAGMDMKEFTPMHSF